MNMPMATDVGGLLDGYAESIRRTPSLDNVWALAQALAAQRSACDSEQWRAFCDTTSRRSILDVMLEDPYTRDARLKPAGYAGDAHTLDYVYLRDCGQQTVSALGRQLFCVTTGVPIAEAVRARAKAIAAEIERHAAQGAPVTVSSVACGHLRELDHVSPAVRQCLSVWGCDQDARSIDRCLTNHRDMRVSTLVGTVRDVLTGRIRIPESNIVYASGLFDYLDDRAASLLIKRMVYALRPGGTALVAHLTPANEEIAYMELVMDWWMHYRTVADLARLAEDAEVRSSHLTVDTSEAEGGRVAWLHVKRL